MLYKGCLMKSDVQLNLRAKESQ
ncbi:hypothetical protein ACLD2W_23920, partial [Salmonella sp. 741265109_PST]|nr:hypothetical protein [Salmonella enterica]